ncbi:interleukin-17D isoform 2-T2 [Glossophaga mutica]
MGSLVWTLAAGVLLAPTLTLALSPGRAGAPRTSRRPARGCADRPEELLEQLYGRLAAGVLGAFQHTLQPGPREQARNTSCPGGRPDWRFRPPTPLRSVSPWAYSQVTHVHMIWRPGQLALYEVTCPGNSAGSALEQAVLRPHPLPSAPAGGLLPVPRLPDRAARGGGPEPSQRAGAAAHRGAAPYPGLRRGPFRLHRGVRGSACGLHLRPRARPRRASRPRGVPRRKRADPAPRPPRAGQEPAQACPSGSGTVTRAGQTHRRPTFF